MLLGVTVLSAAAIVFFNIIVDAAYAFIDPRIRLA
jgi:peptide/nickel transport system permease protein